MSYDFEVGSSQYGLCTDATSYPNAFGWSVSCWFRIESLVSFEAVMGFNGTTDGNVHFNLQVNASNQLQLNRSMIAGNPLAYTTSALSTGQWYLATYAETSRTSRKFWLNATEITTDATDLLSNWTSDENLTRMGVACRPRRVSDGDVANFFDGMVAEVALWPSTILTQANVDSLYGSGTGALASSVAGGPSLWWRLNSDKGSSSYAADTGSGTLTLTGSPVYSATHPTLGASASGVPKSTKFLMTGIG